MSKTGDDPTSRLIELGHIGAAHGIRGEVVIRSYTQDPLAIGRYGPLTDKEGTRAFKLTSLRAAGKGLVARIDGVADRTAAEALRGTGLWCRRDQLPPADRRQDEWYVSDLVDLVVNSGSAVGDIGELFGRVVDVVNFGAGDLLEIRPEGQTETILVPFTKEYVPAIDMAGGVVMIDLPAGFLNGDDDGPDTDERNGD